VKNHVHRPADEKLCVFHYKKKVFEAFYERFQSLLSNPTHFLPYQRFLNASEAFLPPRVIWKENRSVTFASSKPDQP